MERDFYIFDVDTAVIMEEPSDEEKDGDVWSHLMRDCIEEEGTIIERQNYGGRPLYRVDFRDGLKWWCEEHWLKSARYISYTVSDKDVSDIDDFMKEW